MGEIQILLTAPYSKIFHNSNGFLNTLPPKKQVFILLKLSPKNSCFPYFLS